MKKTSKQKKNNPKAPAHQPKQQQNPALLMAAKAEEQPLPATDSVDVTPPSSPVPAEPATLDGQGSSRAAGRLQRAKAHAE